MHYMKTAFSSLGMKQVRISGGPLGTTQRLNEEVTVPHIYGKLADTGRIASLSLATGTGHSERPHPFWDSDIGKTIEAISYRLITKPDAELESRVDSIVDLLEKEQFPDGYLNTYYRTCEIGNRWTNLYYMHELYCAGHLMEGAVAYYEATGKRKFMDLMCRYADHIAARFGPDPGQTRGYCGHPEIELALVRLAKASGNRVYLELSKFFIDERGRQPYYFETESLARGVDTTVTANQKRHLKHFLRSRGPYAEYQAHLPVREQKEPVGHAVRAMYLYSGMADIAAEFGDRELLAACETIWDAMTKTQYAVTGGIGPVSEGERFSFAYDIPNEHTYNESCAAVAQVMWARRMLQFDCDGKYADIMEQTLFNVVLASLSRSGDRYFYANYLAVHPEFFEHASAALIDKMRAERQEWFDVACCPPNISRLIGSLGEYLYSTGEAGIFVHLFAPGTARFDADGIGATLAIATGYPWDGAVRIRVEFEKATRYRIGLRIPGWCDAWSLTVNGTEVPYTLRKGYCVIDRIWRNDTIELDLEIRPVRIESRPDVRENCGRVALKRGPVVYCLEEADNGRKIQDISIRTRGEIRETTGLDGLFSGTVCLELEGTRRDCGTWRDDLYRELQDSRIPVVVRAIPYYLWGNRGFGEMTVWIPVERTADTSTRQPPRSGSDRS